MTFSKLASTGGRSTFLYIAWIQAPALNWRQVSAIEMSCEITFRLFTMDASANDRGVNGEVSISRYPEANGKGTQACSPLVALLIRCFCWTTRVYQSGIGLRDAKQ
jgi:hypothetical protein